MINNEYKQGWWTVNVRQAFPLRARHIQYCYTQDFQVLTCSDVISAYIKTKYTNQHFETFLRFKKSQTETALWKKLRLQDVQKR